MRAEGAQDETCFYLYEAACADNVREAARRAALSVERGRNDLTCDKTEGSSLT